MPTISLTLTSVARSRFLSVAAAPCHVRNLCRPDVNDSLCTGKTILASVVIEEAQKLNPHAAVVYFYCKYHDKGKNTLTAIARELLRQCVPHDPAVLPLMYDKRAASSEIRLDSLATLKDLLETVISSAAKVAIVIDGLDECEEPERKRTLAYLIPLIEQANRGVPGSVRALFTSQDLADMRTKLRRADVIALTAKDNMADIRAYTEHWALEIQRKFDLSGNDIGPITEQVTERAQGKGIPANHFFSSTKQ